MLSFCHQVNLPNAKALVWAVIGLIVVREFRVIKIAFHIDADADLLRSNLGFLFRTSCIVLSWVVVWALTDIRNAEKYSELHNRTRRHFLTLRNGHEENCDINNAENYCDSSTFSSETDDTRTRPGRRRQRHFNRRGTNGCSKPELLLGNRKYRVVKQPHCRLNGCGWEQSNAQLVATNETISNTPSWWSDADAKDLPRQGLLASLSTTEDHEAPQSDQTTAFNSEKPSNDLSPAKQQEEENNCAEICLPESEDNMGTTTYNYRIICNVMHVDITGRTSSHQLGDTDARRLGMQGELVRLEHIRNKMLNLGCDLDGPFLQLSSSDSPCLSSCSTTASDMGPDLSCISHYMRAAIKLPLLEESELEQGQRAASSTASDSPRAESTERTRVCAAALKDYVERFQEPDGTATSPLTKLSVSSGSEAGRSARKSRSKRKAPMKQPRIKPSMDNFVTYKTAVLSPWSLFTVAEMSFVTMTVYAMATYKIYGWASVPIAILTYCGFINLTELTKLFLAPQNRQLRWLVAIVITLMADVGKFGKQVPHNASLEFFASKGNVVSKILIVFYVGFTSVIVTMLGIGISLKLFGGSMPLSRWRLSS